MELRNVGSDFAWRVALGLALGLPLRSALADPRPPLCSIEVARALSDNFLESGFRKAFCTNPASASCNARWANGKLFLDRALADMRIQAVGTIAYMFGTIYVETGTKNFSPDTHEKVWAGNKDADYMKAGFFGRGWIQLTHRENYVKASAVIKQDAVADKSVVEKPDYAYEILYRGMTEGWIEIYRTSANGAADVAYRTPIRLGDFVNVSAVDYDRARAVINANCKKAGGKCSPPNMKVGEHQYIPSPVSLDQGPTAAVAATKMERLLCGLG
uniref:hypothetical protein n=1 Tax=Cupriavidus yeoncheonensis TaxID=1462994 RepID=UPI003F497D2B